MRTADICCGSAPANALSHSISNTPGSIILLWRYMTARGAIDGMFAVLSYCTLPLPLAYLALAHLRRSHLCERDMVSSYHLSSACGTARIDIPAAGARRNILFSRHFSHLALLRARGTAWRLEGDNGHFTAAYALATRTRMPCGLRHNAAVAAAHQTARRWVHATLKRLCARRRCASSFAYGFACRHQTSSLTLHSFASRVSKKKLRALASIRRFYHHRAGRAATCCVYRAYCWFASRAATSYRALLRALNGV